MLARIDGLDKFAFVVGGSTGLQVPECGSVPVDLPPPKRVKKLAKQDLYVLSSTAFPGLVKVGRSNLPERRRIDLSGGQPVQYVLDIVFHGAGEHEPAVHHQLAHVRHKEGYSREWFTCTPDDVVEAFRVVAPSKLEQMERKRFDMLFLG